jgi:hypothetical protein
MSDTPRTNNFDWSFHLLFAEAQTMERELNAANEMLRKLNIHALNLTDRIRRLEEAGDRAIENSYYPDRVKVWNQAKEAKP